MKNEKMKELIQKNKQRNARIQITNKIKGILAADNSFYEGNVQSLIYRHIDYSYDNGIIDCISNLLRMERSKSVFQYSKEISVIPKIIKPSGKVVSARNLVKSEINRCLPLLKKDKIMFSTNCLNESGPIVLQTDDFKENIELMLDTFWEYGDLTISEISETNRFINFIHLDDTEYFEIVYKMMNFDKQSSRGSNCATFMTFE